MRQMPTPANVRSVRSSDYAHWRPLWDSYNAYYGRSGPTALDEATTAQTWARFLDPAERMHAYVAELDDRIIGIAHFLYHRYTSRLQDVCYLQDLFTHEACRGRGVGRALMQHVIDTARAVGSARVYWTTHTSNTAARCMTRWPSTAASSCTGASSESPRVRARQRLKRTCSGRPGTLRLAATSAVCASSFA